jgi:hypothetical protein
MDLSNSKIYLLFGLVLFFLLLFSNKSYLCQSNEYILLSDILENQPKYDEKEVLVSGTICSNVSYYTSYSGNEYEIFDLCNDSKIVVWKRKSFISALEPNKNISLCGRFTTRYEEPEIYYVAWAR